MKDNLSGQSNVDGNRLIQNKNSLDRGALNKNFDNSLIQKKEQSGNRGGGIQKTQNNTGLPDTLKQGVESLSGLSMDDVKVHYNSSKPAGLGALAYAQGTDIHISPGQEKHLPHEAWHVVQQKQGEVKPTVQMKGGVAVNDAADLENEADIMGSKANGLVTPTSVGVQAPGTHGSIVANDVVQLNRDENKEHYSKLLLKFGAIKSAYAEKRAEAGWLLNNERVKEGIEEKQRWYLRNRLEHLLPELDKVQDLTFDENFSNGKYKKLKYACNRLGGDDLKLLTQTITELKKLHYEFSGKHGERKIINQPGYATGDVFGIAASLIDDPNLDIVISRGAEKGTAGYDPTDKADALVKFYTDSGIEPWRIHMAQVSDLRDEGAKAMKGKTRSIQKGFDPKLSNRAIDNNMTFTVSGGTDYVATHWSDEMRSKVRNAWDVNDSKDKEIQDWLRYKNVPVSGKNVAILWSRFSGKKGDIHLEHDTSYKGMEQIVIMAKEKYAAVIIAGDPYATPDKVGKFTQIARKAGLNVFDLTGFWEHKNDLLKAWGGDTRFGQFKLYDYLDRHFEELKHLGFRSGNLEAMAMLGHQVRYMEEPDSKGGERMEKWHEKEGGKTAMGGVATGYERLMVDKPPTRSGQFLRAFQGEFGDRPAWAPGRDPQRVKPDQIYSYESGFNERDLTKIGSYLGVERPGQIMREPASFSPFVNLTTLDLTGMEISSDLVRKLISYIVADLLPSLTRLDISESHSETVEAFGDLKKVQVNYR
ncbi:DUF4157 domain-containing protein [Fulvivirga sp. 29W222]|uniref:DUF4157 domain-containing protein n=1 Tax=Fulvivirga marina TaxID=2494733 RepID=A0A937KC34_9BACT|nr:DUF4157 domain-containing protein [Fulvivirga marina]MBL6447736.1 DUF4157 domain-containing protein [Fulvivirga marina]